MTLIFAQLLHDVKLKNFASEHDTIFKKFRLERSLELVPTKRFIKDVLPDQRLSQGRVGQQKVPWDGRYS